MHCCGYCQEPWQHILIQIKLGCCLVMLKTPGGVGAADAKIRGSNRKQPVCCLLRLQNPWMCSCSQESW